MAKYDITSYLPNTRFLITICHITDREIRVSEVKHVISYCSSDISKKIAKNLTIFIFHWTTRHVNTLNNIRSMNKHKEYFISKNKQ